MNYFHRVTTIVGITVALSGLNSASAQLEPTQQPRLEAQAEKVSPSIQLPALTGPYPVGSTFYHLVDHRRNDIYDSTSTKRELMIYVWYPSHALPGETIPAPYQDEAVVKEIRRAYAKSLGLKADTFVKLLCHSVQTHTTAQAPFATVQTRYPLLIFSHGFGVPPKLDTSLLEQLASHGYVVVSLSHTYDVPTLFPDGQVIKQSSRFHFRSSNQAEIKPIFDEAVDVRSRDVSFVLDELTSLNISDPQGILTHHLDLDRVGILGHSLGGATAAETMLLDRRFKAGINLDGIMYGTAFAQGTKDGLDRPFMLVNHEGQTLDPALKSLQMSFYEKLKANGYHLIIKGTKHMTFTDLPLIFPLLKANSDLKPQQAQDAFGAIDPHRAEMIVTAYALAFFDKYLNKQKEPLLSGASADYPEVQFDSRNGTPTALP
ncbi:MAG: alpha/beta hydrolase family protein [Leptolyngbya sp. BL-A-14]